MPSYQAGDTCVSTPLLANQYRAGTETGKIVQVGTASYVTNVTSVSATQIVYQLQNVSSTAVINKTVTISPNVCGLIDTADALSLAWKIVLCWIAVYALKLAAQSIQSMYHGEPNGS